MKQSTVSLRLPRATYDRLSALAGEHCLTRPKMVALLLERGPPPVDVEPGRALELLAEERALWATAMYAGLRRGELSAAAVFGSRMRF